MPNVHLSNKSVRVYEVELIINMFIVNCYQFHLFSFYNFLTKSMPLYCWPTYWLPDDSQVVGHVALHPINSHLEQVTLVHAESHLAEPRSLIPLIHKKKKKFEFFTVAQTTSNLTEFLRLLRQPVRSLMQWNFEAFLVGFQGS